MKADAVKYGAMIYMLWFTCRHLLAAYSGTRHQHRCVSDGANYNFVVKIRYFQAQTLS